MNHEDVPLKEHLEKQIAALEQRFTDYKATITEGTRLLASSNETSQKLLADNVKVQATDIEKRLQRITNVTIGLLAIGATLAAAFILKK